VSNKRIWLVAILITLLLVGYTFLPMVRTDQRVSYAFEFMPWSGSYTAVVELPYWNPDILKGGG